MSDRADALTPQQIAAAHTRERHREHEQEQQKQRQWEADRAQMKEWCASFRGRWRVALDAMAAKLPADGAPCSPLSVADLNGELRAFGRLMAEKDQRRGEDLSQVLGVDPAAGSRPWFDPATGTVNTSAHLPSRSQAFVALRSDFVDSCVIDAAMLLLASYDGGTDDPLLEPADPCAFGWLLKLASLTGLDHDLHHYPLSPFDPFNIRYPRLPALMPDSPLVWKYAIPTRDTKQAERILTDLRDMSRPDWKLFPTHFTRPEPYGEKITFYIDDSAPVDAPPSTPLPPLSAGPAAGTWGGGKPPAVDLDDARPGVPRVPADPTPAGEREEGGPGADDGKRDDADDRKSNEMTDADDEPKLNDRQISILCELHGKGAFSRRQRKKQRVVVKPLKFAVTVATVKRDFANLTGLQLTESGFGPDGGVWLTSEGMKLAEKLLE